MYSMNQLLDNKIIVRKYIEDGYDDYEPLAKYRVELDSQVVIDAHINTETDENLGITIFSGDDTDPYIFELPPERMDEELFDLFIRVE